VTAPPFFLASRAAFSSALIRLIRGSVARTESTRVRSRVLSSFFRRVRSDLFFFSVNRLSSRLKVWISEVTTRNEVEGSGCNNQSTGKEVDRKEGINRSRMLADGRRPKLS